MVFCDLSTYYASYFQSSHFLLKVLLALPDILTNLQDKDLVNVYPRGNTNFRELSLAAG